MAANDKRHNLFATLIDVVTFKIGGVDKTSAIGSISNKIDSSEKGAANGVAPLDGSSKIASTYLPAIAITDTFVVASQVAMLALTAQTGDVAVRSDLNKSFILAGTNPAVLGDWQELLTPTDSVTSVNGQTGVVSITTITGNAGTATALQTARAINGVNFDGTANIEVMSTATQAATDKATPVDADTFSIFDSASSFVLKKLTWANLKATLKTYFDSLSTTLTNKRITPRYSEENSNVAPSINTDNVDEHIILAQAADMTGSGITWTGTPTRNQKLGLSITPTGGVRQLIFDTAKFEESYSQLFPTETFADGVRMDMGFKFNNATGKMRLLSVS